MANLQSPSMLWRLFNFFWPTVTTTAEGSGKQTTTVIWKEVFLINVFHAAFATPPKAAAFEKVSQVGKNVYVPWFNVRDAARSVVLNVLQQAACCSSCS